MQKINGRVVQKIIDYLIINNDRNGYTKKELESVFMQNLDEEIKFLWRNGLIYAVKRKYLLYFLISSTNTPNARKIKQIKKDIKREDD